MHRADRKPGVWRTIPRRALMHSGLGRRLWWWTRGRRSELKFWGAWMVGAPGAEEWTNDRELRFATETPIRDPLLRAELDRNPADEISILDVGAGPVTKLGYRHPGKTLRIVPVDPLADAYARLLENANLVPPIRTMPVAGEALLDRFGPRAFDIAHAVNSLDHSADPFAIVSNMVAVVREGGIVLLRHHRNEGEREQYEGLHQWNFDVAGGNLILWNNAVRVNITAELEGRAEVEAWVEHDEVIVRIVVGAS
jgi:SAM-dependent methyltransferase